jgi:hypothetical protein
MVRVRQYKSTSMTPDHGTGMHRKKGSAAVEKEKAPGTYCQRRLPPPLTYATAGVAGGSDVVGDGVVGFFRRAFVFGLVFPFALVFPLVFDLVFMVFPFSVASADHGNTDAREQGLRRSTKKKPPDLRNDRGLPVTFASLTGEGGLGDARLACAG